MDVTCTRCGTVYEFEEGLVSTTGTTVKCTQCGHLFKVHRTTPASDEPPADDGEGRELRWHVRRVNGSAHMLESLTELTRLITAGQFARDDEISRTGQVWKKLGDIHELASLFEPPASARPRRQSDFPGASSPPPPPSPPASQDEEPARTSTPPPPPPPPAAAGEVGVRKRTRSMAERLPAPAAEAAADTVAARADAVAAEPAARSEGGTAAAATSSAAPPRGPAVDELEAPMRARSRLGLVILIGVPIVVGAAIAAALALRPAPPQPQPAEQEVQQSARPFMQRGDQAMSTHLPARFDEAIAEYTKALAFHPDDAHILSSISRVYASWSQWLGVRLRFLEAADAAQAELAALRVEARRLADQAKLYGERAAQRNPGNEEASVALSDALRLTGNLVAARAELDRARATEGVASAETLRVAALLAIDEAHGDLRAGRALAEQAVASDPNMIRARVLLALCLIAAGDLDGARMHLDAAHGGGTPHPIIDEVRAEIARIERQGAQPPPAPEPAPPEPLAETKRDETKRDETKRDETKRDEAKRDEAKRDDDGPDELVTKGENALERGAVQQAQRLFEDALSVQPGMARAKTGLGYVALERSQPRQAINHFRPAAKNGNPEALIGLGDAYRRLGRVRDALDSYKEYMQRYPRGERRSIAQRQIELLTEQLESSP